MVDLGIVVTRMAHVSTRPNAMQREVISDPGAKGVRRLTRAGAKDKSLDAEANAQTARARRAPSRHPGTLFPVLAAPYHISMRSSAGPSPSHRASRCGFTLIEVLVVVVIIAVLASIVAPNVFRHVDTAKNVTAQAQISTLGAALDAYRLDNGRYPTTEQGLAALWTTPTLEPRPSNWRGPYLRQPPPADAWGAPFVYRSPGDHLANGFDLSSLGADGAPGGAGDGTDITNWKQP